MVARDPNTGARNVSMHRLQVLGPDRLGILILPRHLSHFYRAAEQAGKPLEVAIAIGVDPLLLLASQALRRSASTSSPWPARSMESRCNW